jgi:hypothetical protein
MRLKLPPFDVLKRINAVISLGAVFRSLGEIMHDKYEIKKEPSPQDLDEWYGENYSTWYKDTLAILEECFEDSTPATMFKYPREMVHLEDVNAESKGHKPLSSIQSRLNVLYDLYTMVQESVRTPLAYAKEAAVLSYFGIECGLTPETAEADLCRYMFKFSIGSWQEFEDVYDFMFANKQMKKTWEKGWEKKIVYAYDGVNRKTNKTFGFPILKKDKNLLIALTLPSRFVARLD